MKKLAIIGAAVVILAGVSAYAKPHGGKRFDKMDANNDGQITREEMVSEAQKRASKRFDHVDTNDDGAISKEEMKFSKEKFKQKWRKKRKEKKQNERDAAEESTEENTEEIED